VKKEEAGGDEGEREITKEKNGGPASRTNAGEKVAVCRQV